MRKQGEGMEALKETDVLVKKLETINNSLEEMVKLYLEEYSTYWWDEFAETLANVAAQVDMLRIKAENAKVVKPYV
jgi:uncharacterized protein YbaP (TraB family)